MPPHPASITRLVQHDTSLPALQHSANSDMSNKSNAEGLSVRHSSFRTWNPAHGGIRQSPTNRRRTTDSETNKGDRLQNNISRAELPTCLRTWGRRDHEP